MLGDQSPVEIAKSIPPMSIVADQSRLSVRWWGTKWHFAWFERLSEDQIMLIRIEIFHTEESGFEPEADYETLLEKAETVSIRMPGSDALPEVVREQLEYNGFEVVEPEGL